LADAFADLTVLAELGRGTAGLVREARHASLNRRVALKRPVLGPEPERPASHLGKSG
jgi:hypothetical protein